MSSRWIYGFDALDAASERCGNDWDAVRGLLGGKGANLADMTRLEIPVPPGFTITSDACNAFLDSGEHLPEGLIDELAMALRQVEHMTGKVFGDPANPLLLSCRSGAKFSMPGMMDTVLNIGLNDDVTDGMAKMFDDRHFALDSYRRSDPDVLDRRHGNSRRNPLKRPFENSREALGVWRTTAISPES